MDRKIWAVVFMACIVAAGCDGAKDQTESTNNLTVNSRQSDVLQEKSAPEPTNSSITKAVEIIKPLKYVNKRLGFSLEFREAWRDHYQIDDIDNKIVINYLRPSGDKEFLLSIERHSREVWDRVVKDDTEVSAPGGILLKTDKYVFSSSRKTDAMGEMSEEELKVFAELIEDVRDPNVSMKFKPEGMKRSLIDPRTIRVGDTFAGLKVASVKTADVHDTNKDCKCYYDMVKVQFRGSIEVTGDYEVQDPDFSEGVIFHVDPDSGFPEIQIYENKDDNDLPDSISLQFTEKRQQERFGKPGTKGRARLVISDYFYVYSQSDERSKAKVKEVGHITEI
ncbi:hypothetical protein [Paenibacillus tyrfis]|uniref:hypothetical protein n=1 Tax=Paenibacillus tyrfis TaxID=1501230 RepID=UPI000B58E957|nr:hypothetical protein [Paenibacillus tyrfis]